MPRLRTGFTTGTYAAATALAAWRCLSNRRPGATVGVVFPDGRVRRVNVDGVARSGRGAQAWARKDAGDDVDCTNGAVIQVLLLPAAATDVLPQDHIVPCGRACLIIRGGSGVGRVTRPGLEVPPDKWAVNSGPRRMIAENLLKGGAGKEELHWLIQIGIDHGEELARKTLNPLLGVVGGLSILGTSGIVVPCSNEAYIRTIEILLEGNRRAGGDTAVLVTGGRTQKAAQREYGLLPESSFIRIGDFIRQSCEKASDLGFREIIVCCMPGKLAKYALAIENTHAHRETLSMLTLAALLHRDNVPADVITTCRTSSSMREFLDNLDSNALSLVVDLLSRHARSNLSRWAPASAVIIRVLSTENDKWLI